MIIVTIIINLQCFRPSYYKYIGTRLYVIYIYNIHYNVHIYTMIMNKWHLRYRGSCKTPPCVSSTQPVSVHINYYTARVSRQQVHHKFRHYVMVFMKSFTLLSYFEDRIIGNTALDNNIILNNIT